MRGLIIVLCVVCMCGCYSFRGISIDPAVNTFSVETFEDNSGQIPPGYNEIFSEALVQKILSDTRLDLSRTEGDIIFSGRFSRFEVEAENPGRETQTDLNRLHFTIQVESYNVKTEEEWTQEYRDVIDFDADVNFSDVEDDILKILEERMVERIFVDAFTNW